MPTTYDESLIDEYSAPGSEWWFEYHCWESHDSADAEVWYRSHQRVTVLYCENAHDYGCLSFHDRCDLGHQLVYKVRFQDGLVWSVFEDELLTDPKHFERPDPPKNENI